MRGNGSAEVYVWAKENVAGDRQVRRYRVIFEVTVELDVQDDDVIERVLQNKDNWRGTFYGWSDEEAEEGAVVMLAYALWLDGLRLSQLDGWADLSDEAAHATGTTNTKGWKRTL